MRGIRSEAIGRVVAGGVPATSVPTPPDDDDRVKDLHRMPSSLRGADIVVRTLERAGHTDIFTLSGNHIMSLFDAAGHVTWQTNKAGAQLIHQP